MESAAAAPGASSCPAPCIQQDVLRYTRKLTNKTYLKRMNVPQYMSDYMLPTMAGSHRGARSCSPALAGNTVASTATAGAADGEAEQQVAGRSSYRLLFKAQVRLVDSNGREWPVVYEGTTSAGQRHLRLTCGWSEFIKAKKISIGDAITFERRGTNKAALAVAVQRAGQEPEQVWPGRLPEEQQVKVLVGQLREGPPSPVAAAAAAPGAGAAGGEAAAAGTAGAAGNGTRRTRAAAQSGSKRQQQPCKGNSHGRRVAKRGEGSRSMLRPAHSTARGFQGQVSTIISSEYECEEEEEEEEEEGNAAAATELTSGGSSGGGSCGSAHARQELNSSLGGSSTRGSDAAVGGARSTGEQLLLLPPVAPGRDSQGPAGLTRSPLSRPVTGQPAAATSQRQQSQQQQQQQPQQQQQVDLSRRWSAGLEQPWRQLSARHHPAAVAAPAPTESRYQALQEQQQHQQQKQQHWPSAVALGRSHSAPVANDDLGMAVLEGFLASPHAVAGEYGLAPAAAAAAAAGGGLRRSASVKPENAGSSWAEYASDDRGCVLRGRVLSECHPAHAQPRTSRYGDLRQQLRWQRQQQQQQQQQQSCFMQESGFGSSRSTHWVAADDAALVDVDGTWDPQQLFGQVSNHQHQHQHQWQHQQPLLGVPTSVRELPGVTAASGGGAAAAAATAEILSRWQVSSSSSNATSSAGSAGAGTAAGAGWCQPPLLPAAATSLSMQQHASFQAQAAASPAAVHSAYIAASGVTAAAALPAIAEEQALAQQWPRQYAPGYDGQQQQEQQHVQGVRMQQQLLQQLQEERRRISVEQHLLLLLQQEREQQRQLHHQQLQQDQQHQQLLQAAPTQQQPQDQAARQQCWQQGWPALPQFSAASEPDNSYGHVTPSSNEAGAGVEVSVPLTASPLPSSELHFQALLAQLDTADDSGTVADIIPAEMQLLQQPLQQQQQQNPSAMSVEQVLSAPAEAPAGAYDSQSGAAQFPCQVALSAPAIAPAAAALGSGAAWSLPAVPAASVEDGFFDGPV